MIEKQLYLSFLLETREPAATHKNKKQQLPCLLWKKQAVFDSVNKPAGWDKNDLQIALLQQYKKCLLFGGFIFLAYLLSSVKLSEGLNTTKNTKEWPS